MAGHNNKLVSMKNLRGSPGKGRLAIVYAEPSWYCLICPEMQTYSLSNSACDHTLTIKSSRAIIHRCQASATTAAHTYCMTSSSARSSQTSSLLLIITAAYGGHTLAAGSMHKQHVCKTSLASLPTCGLLKQRCEEVSQITY